MLIFWKEQLAILAVPKTGTTALEQALTPFADAAILNPPGLKHCTVRKFRRELSGFFEQKGKRPLALCAVMREPISWLGSWYRYRGRPQLDGHPNSTAKVSFDEFIDAYLSAKPPEFARVGSQAQFLEGGVDYLFRYDRPEDLLGFLQDRLGRSIDLPRLNVSPVIELTLSEKMRSRLEKQAAADFALWKTLTRQA
ncbi:gamma-glutamyl kinase [Jannaschia pohangensis]|uniref:Gamma-glutamyl kinase n=1 Tax=Jannaschia pohangensis TaxID=390807 RepID=A0A1I3GC41_9RHOB|nr:gamma-glutamyl kinase [Jannaschia pohangensis]SFI21095.1 hypothetical protein SAMN04488095_0137 [Jannaschia pohangensis]